MYEELTEVVIHLILLAGYTLIAGALLIGGLFLEYQGYLVALAGDVTLALWIAGIGFVILAFAYLVVRDKILVEFARTRT